MRPSSAALDASARPRKQSIEQPIALSSGTAPGPGPAPGPAPSAFFLASESDLARRGSNTSTSGPSHDSSRVRTLKETIEEASQQTRTSLTPTHRRDGSRRRSTIRPRSIEELRYEAARQQAVTPTTTPPTSTQIPSLPTSQASSLPGSPKSFSSRSLPKSDDDYSSQAVESEDEDQADQAPSLSASMQDSAPQLIMPSIRMPSRRPFTERGKQLGKFKIMVVGSRGTGKTSLIKSIVQLCEDIVHVDPLASSVPSRPKAQSRSTANAFRETYASTKTYPTWWSDMEDSRVLKRRKSTGDVVLERNICFVDTAHSKSPMFAAHYVEQQLAKTINCANQASGELTGLLSGRGGTQVDLVLYLVSHDTFKHDLDHIHQLSTIANIVPLIAKSDLLTPDHITEIRNSLSLDICCIPRLPITFSSQITLDTPPLQASAPYTISCVNGPDFDNMDASLLMSSEYIQPLLPSELGLLIDQMFQPDVVAYLRHTAAKKLISWYNSGSRLNDSTSVRTQSPISARTKSPILSTLDSPLQASLSASGMLVPVHSHSELSLNTSNSFALAKVADHAHKEERLAQIRLSRWASDLQLSLQREREKYENIARSERALWLVERMGEEIRDGQLVPVAEIHDAEVAGRPRGKRKKLFRDGSMTYQVHDPLGLLKWQDLMRAQTWLALQVVGSFGVIGGLALWVTKQWGYETGFHTWARDMGVWRD
ncbi:hypothetical protein LTR70_009537 [Exophiala xenobiotica]|nr:hypothetical protein LTR70_009537 [Exophiala xenobiotica]